MNGASSRHRSRLARLARSTRLAALGVLVAVSGGCESKNDVPASKPAHVHPDFPVPPSPEMIAQSLDLEGDGGARRALGAPSADPDPAHWNPSCLAKRG